jgi:hypothetical protein
MKNLKILFFSIVISLITFTSCTNEDPIINADLTQDSASAREALTELRSRFNNDGTFNQDENPSGNILFDFCFDFVYPITLSYNTGANVIINNFDDLVGVILGSTNNLFIDGIAFPFQVETYDNGAVIIRTINTETEFISLITTCDFEEEDCVCSEQYEPVCIAVTDTDGASFIVEFPNMCYAECEGFTQNDIVDCTDNGNPGTGNGNDDCYTYVYPISVTSDGVITIINSDQELENYIYSLNRNFDFVFPFNVTLADGTVETITSPNGLYLLIDSCDSNSNCNCPTDYNPVCVTNPNGVVVEFGNFCLAMCDGYTQADVVNCNNNTNCDIRDLVVTTDCFSQSVYSITIDFIHENAGNEFFDVYDASNNQLIGFYALADLPITIEGHFIGQAGSRDGIRVSINDNPDCYADAEWDSIDCFNNGSDCLIDNVAVTIGDCISESMYNISLNFDVTNPNNDQFMISLGNNNFSGPYNLADLPVVLDVPANGVTNSLIITLVNSNCIGDAGWVAPDCTNQTNCWSFVYPVDIATINGVITANSDADVTTAFANPADQAVLVYPFNVTVNGTVEIINTPNNFSDIGGFDNQCQ